jgi:cytochrome c553
MSVRWTILSGLVAALAATGTSAPPPAGLPRFGAPFSTAEGLSQESVERVKSLAPGKRLLVIVTPETSSSNAPDGVREQTLALREQLARQGEAVEVVVNRGSASPRPALWLLDEARVVRAVFPLAEAGTIQKGLRLYELGRDVYATQCARCHGADGDDNFYPGIKTLGGIGNRWTPQRIDESIRRSNTVDTSRFTPEEREGITLYVRGL